MLAVIIGRRRQGKSTLALSLARSRKRTVIIFDPNNQYNAVPAITSEQLAVWLPESKTGDIVRIVPTDAESDWPALAEVLDGNAWRWGDYVLILDECSMLMSPQWIDPALERYARTCPNDVDLILTTHRMVDVHTLFRALASDWYIFHQHLDRDVDLISFNFGSRIAEESKRLPEYHLIHFWLERGGTPTFKVWNKPAAWFVDIGRLN
jgi:hypothetical protein